MKVVFLASLLLFTSLSQAAKLPSVLEADALQSLKPGAVVELAERSIETTGYIQLKNLRGTAESPITIRAMNRGKTIISGHAGFDLSNCEHVILEGLVFENDANQHAVRLTDCHHVRITRCQFRLNEKQKPRWSQHWVYALGSKSGHNRVDHNLFEQQSQKGSMVFMRGDDTTLTPSQYDRIDHNHFRNVIYADNNNGHETLRTGSNDMGAAGKSTFTTIENNLLERCSGEQEIISLKSSDNTVRNNTFVDCRGSICLRLGNRNKITGNIMLNPGRVAGAGGVKIYGFEHQVSGNYFEGLTGTGHEAPLALIPGIMDTQFTDQIGKAYKDQTTAPATRVSITQNTWLNCAPLVFGQDKPDKERGFVPNQCLFTDNTVIHTEPQKAPLVRLGLIEGFKTENNTAHTDKGASKDSWAEWFQWKSPAPDTQKPRPVNDLEVGPDSAEEVVPGNG